MMPDIFATGDVDLKKLLNAEDRKLISQIKSILGPFILRRLKSDVMQQLVPKIQHVKFVVMGTEQSEAYKNVINEYRAACQARSAKSSDGISNNIAGLIPKRQISNYFTQFRKVVNDLNPSGQNLQNKEDLQSIRFDDDVEDGKSHELKVYSLDRIRAVTINFSDSNKLGEGGFGPVYMGTLPGGEVAVKRLCRNSGQGLEEFKNEVILNANGYMSTEYAMEGIFSIKSDVYGFGVLILSFHCHEDSLNIAGYVNTGGY
ncbi:hypothetical protein ZEAMMB73_Zm00001d012385 [Zea mays]|uniref:SNF2 N-terminal domain-containing protein n=1 Tax=Zea mays TaxID=4577 RepID=A0A1D6G8E1_MAIZE|nr:hypothetical protein ZEAMMB73_Zm00001d012385 [Zea mays]